MIDKLFPFKLHLHIFQLESYRSKRFIKWVLSHFWVRTTENKKPLIWTQKAKLLYYSSIFLALIVVALLTLIYKLAGFIFGLLLLTQAYIFILLAFLFMWPLETYRKNLIKSQTETKLKTLSKLRIVGVTGSYGKTSVKNYLHQILKTRHKSLMTPESYNTPQGIAKVVYYELDDSYEYFICEMGAYKRGEIKEICDMVHPQYGILTAINEQHLDTFGSLENTTLGKFELIDALPSDSFGIVNIDNERIKNHAKNYKINLIGYGFSDEFFTVKNMHINNEGTSFDLVLNGKTHKAQTKLLGKPNIHNILAAATASFKLGMKPDDIVEAIKYLQPVPHRLEIKEFKKMTLIDNAFNSNVDGFKESIDLLATFKRPTIFVTPGVVDLGNKTYEIHKMLGSHLDKIDHVILVNPSERTKGLKDGMTQKNKIVELNSINDLWDTLEKMKIERPVVLLENDLPDNY